MKKSEFNSGDIISWCEQKFLVVWAGSEGGIVQEYPNGPLVSAFKYNYEDEVAELVQKATPETIKVAESKLKLIS